MQQFALVFNLRSDLRMLYFFYSVIGFSYNKMIDEEDSSLFPSFLWNQLFYKEVLDKTFFTIALSVFTQAELLYYENVILHSTDKIPTRHFRKILAN